MKVLDKILENSYFEPQGGKGLRFQNPEAIKEKRLTYFNAYNFQHLTVKYIVVK